MAYENSASWIFGLMNKYKNYKMPCKQIYDLSEDDLLNNPVWEYLSGEDSRAIDECTVIARNPERIEDVESSYIALASFELNNGVRLNGYVYPDQSSIPYAQPLIFFPNNKSLTFWFGISVLCERKIKDIYSSIGLSADEIFPVKWSCKYASIMGATPKGFPTYETPVFLGVGDVSGVIEGFGYYLDSKEVYIK